MEIRVNARQGPPIATTEIDHDLTAVSFPKHEPWTNVHAVTLTEVDFGGHTFGPFNALGTTFVRCRFDGAKLRSGKLGGEQSGTPQARYVDCSFDGARFTAALRPGNARFERCTFRRTKISGWRAFQAEFVDCEFSGELRGCWFTGSTERAQYPAREVNEFRGNDFSDAKLIECQFDYGIDVMAQRWPVGPEYLLLDRFHERVSAARSVIARWPNDTSREAALSCLRNLSDGMSLQGAGFLRRQDFLSWLPDARDEMFRLLEIEPGG